MKREIEFTTLQAERETRKRITRYGTLEYPMDLYIQEVQRVAASRAVVPFTLKTVTKPEVASFTVHGVMSMEGTADEVDDWIAPHDSQPPKVWQDVYQATANVLAVMAKVLEVPFPMPKIGGITVGS
jgi:hypothetical protein